ncbi:MAG: AAA family ATPase, partial [Candidatus Hadarchaeales archaeon]
MALRRRRGIVLGVFSAKGGVGKTTTVANLGAALAQRKKGKVIIVETNMTASNLGLHLGVVDPPVTVQDLVMGRLKVEEGISKTEYGLHLLPGSIAFTTEVGSVDL